MYLLPCYSPLALIVFPFSSAADPALNWHAHVATKFSQLLTLLGESYLGTEVTHLEPSTIATAIELLHQAEHLLGSIAQPCTERFQ